MDCNLKNKDLQNFLDNFVKTFQMEDGEELVDMMTTKMVIDSIDSNKDLHQFTEIVNQKGLSDTPTGLFLCDFDKNEDISIIRIIEKYNGLYNVQLISPLNIESSLEKEDNEIYAVFSNPIDSYKCFFDIKKLNNDNLKYNEGVEDISYILH